MHSTGGELASHKRLVCCCYNNFCFNEYFLYFFVDTFHNPLDVIVYFLLSVLFSRLLYVSLLGMSHAIIFFFITVVYIYIYIFVIF